MGCEKQDVDEVLNLLEQGNKLGAVKLYAEKAQCSLLVAKYVVESMDV